MNSKRSLPLYLKIIIAILLCEATGFLSSLISMPGMYPWFSEIKKPSWNPPASVFAPVWTTLYCLMGISLALVWHTKAGLNRTVEKENAIRLFVLQLFLNFWWSIAFFGFHSPLIALVIIILMVITIISTIFKFSHFSKTASWLLVPYISWVCFATILNFTIWRLNLD